MRLDFANVRNCGVTVDVLTSRLIPAFVVLVVACGDNRTAPDAAIAIDARADASIDAACETRAFASCTNAVARVSIEAPTGCAAPIVHEYTCTTSCSLTFDRIDLGRGTMIEFEPVVLCAETPAMFPGAPCGPTLCLPTRAQLATDGTVIGQQYIVCGEETCIPRPAPVALDRACVGDWECPTGMLCDDLVTPGTTVCKPGPRGVP